MIPQVPLYQEQECGCYCRPPRGRESFLAIFRIGVFQIAWDFILLFFSLIFLHLWRVCGDFLVFAFVFSLIGSSIAVCCCPTQNGWRANIALQVLSLILRGIVAIVCIVYIAITNKPNTFRAAITCKFLQCVFRRVSNDELQISYLYY